MKLKRWIGRIHLRLLSIFLAVFVLAPVVWLATRLFPGESRQSLATGLAFALAGGFAFFILGPRRGR